MLLGWTLYALRPDDRLSDSQPTGSEAYQALAHCDREMGGIQTIEVRVFWAKRMTPDQVLEAIRQAEAVFADEALVHNQLSIRDFLSQLPGAGHGVASSAYLALLPETIQDDYFNRRTRRAKITGRIQDLGIATYEPVFSRIEDRLAALKKEMPGFHFDLHGSPVHRSGGSCFKSSRTSPPA